MKTVKLLIVVILVSIAISAQTALAGHSHTSVSVRIGGGYHGGYHGGFHGYYGHGYRGHGYWRGGIWIDPWYDPFYPGVVVVGPPPIVVAQPVVYAPSPVIVSAPAPVYTTSPGTVAVGSGAFQVPDYDGLNAIGAKMKMQGMVQPITQTAAQAAGAQNQKMSQADTLVDDAVNAFGAGDYSGAAEKLRGAVRLDPNDSVLAFMYAQALFANNEYEKAAAVISTVMAEMGPNPQEISYPRGLYKNEALLNSQIKNLERAVSMDPQNADMHLLLGYEYLGTGRLDESRATLAAAMGNNRTKGPAQSLTNLIDRVKQTPADANGVKK